MAPYSPPNTHYTQINLKEYDDERRKLIEGYKGSNLYKWTKQYKLKYMWHNRDTQVLELWGTYDILIQGVKDKIESDIRKMYI